MVILEAEGLEKSFGASRVLRGVRLEVATGERVVVLGGNGSGKSTLLQVLAGVLTADRGKVAIHGTVGLAPERPDLPDHLLAAEWLDVVASLKGLRRRENLLFGVDAIASIKLGALSLGQRQRVSLAAAWLGEPSILLLDEPTNAIDDETREALAASLLSRTALIATHDHELAARVGTRVLTMRGGALA